MQLEINYPPKFQVRYGHGKPQAQHIARLLARKKNEQRAFLTRASTFSDQMSAIPMEPVDDIEPHWNQSWLPPLDAISLYSLVSMARPNKVVEIRSGNSTQFIKRAIRDHELTSQITSIDPQPRAEIDHLSDLVHREGLEDVPLDIFSTLEKDDIVFFDGSHRCFQNSDVTTFFVDVLPLLRPNVIVGIHDIFWPSDYPERWVKRYYNEQYVLAAYMLALGRHFPLILSCAYAGIELASDAQKCVSKELKAQLRAAGRGIGGGCLWFYKPDILL